MKPSSHSFSPHLIADSTGHCYDIPTAYTGHQKRISNHQNYHDIQQLLQSISIYRPISDQVNIQYLQKSNFTVTKKYREAIYYGECREGQKNGVGIILYTNGRVYQGTWSNNLKHGKGYEKFPNQSIYTGEYVKGKPEGFGRYEWSNGEVYEGQWINGLKNGSGIWRGSKGDSYIGEWKDGKADGYGVHTWINGDRYQGQFKNCLKHGEGVQKFANGDSYKGLYENGKPNGYGEYYWSQGSYFKGIFKNGLRDGKGVWKRGPGNTDRYEGEYRNDKKQGYGVFTWCNGSVYKGQYHQDQREGDGQMVWGDRSYFKGQWKNGVHQGQIVYICQNIHERDNQEIFQQEFQSNFYNEPERPCILQLNKKSFRARGLTSNKSCRDRSLVESCHSREKTPNDYSSFHVKLNKKYSVGSKIDQNSKNKLANKIHINQNKNMSASFFLYKIHKNPQIVEKPYQRAIKTSGGIRNKKMVQQINYFTKSKINNMF